MTGQCPDSDTVDCVSGVGVFVEFYCSVAGCEIGDDVGN